MSKKLLNDLAGILAELEVSYDVADGIATLLNLQTILIAGDYDEFVNRASNVPSCGECGC